ncbi:hypothetical protein B9Z55_012314 [Caenorhabditis nigoni]|uniref:F-box domain-containing protein n=1 Tax=Caenorhabditis nigoni TaxID=1611254 RepID=A0A2G5TWP7_9PELO|nr:hypothetical protein B9Z55_012314 [Caenorhabditis nigoni]
MKFLETAFLKKSKPKIRLPVLQLPRVVLLECIENLDVLEIIIFSLLSKRVKSIAELIRWNLLEIRLLYDVGGPIDICLNLSTHPGLTWIITFTNKKKLKEYPYFKSFLTGPKVDHCLYLQDNGNAIEDSKQMAEHICEVFRSPIHYIQIAEESQIEWIVKFQPTIRYFCICKDGTIPIETFNRAFKNLKVTEHFWLGTIAKNEEIRSMKPIPSPSISMRNSCWFTLPSILKGNYSNIILDGSKLTSKDINAILKEWQLGSKLRNLEYLKIETITLLDIVSYIHEIFKDLDWTDDEIDGRPLTIKIHDEYIYTLPQVQNVFNIMRRDGMILSIFLHYDILEGEKMKILLHLQVWGQQT